MLLLAAIAIPLGLDLYLPVPEGNPLTAAKIEQGRRLFHDRRLSRDQSISCASCHDPERAFSDTRPVAIGIFGRKGRRNAPALINRGYGRSFFWDARARTLEEQVLKPIEDPNEMDLSLSEAATRVGSGVLAWRWSNNTPEGGAAQTLLGFSWPRHYLDSCPLPIVGMRSVFPRHVE